MTRHQQDENEYEDPSASSSTKDEDTVPPEDAGTRANRHDTDDQRLFTLGTVEHRSTPLGVVGLLGITTVLWWSSDLLGLATGFVIVVLWYLAPASLSVAAGYVSLAALAPNAPTTVLTAFVLATVVVLLADVPVVVRAVPVRLLLGMTVMTTLLGAVAYGTLVTTGSHSLAVFVLFVVFGLVGYVLYRYGIVQQQLLEEQYGH